MTVYVDLPPGLANARDTGGLPTVDGGHTRAGRLLRSATPFLLGPDEVAALLERTGLTLRVDLRSRGEVAGTAGNLLARHERRAVHAPLRSGGPDAVPDLADPVEAMTAHYLRYLEHSPTSFAAIVSALVEPREGPALVHCTLGKDRTGVVAAVLLSAIGVGTAALVDDYAATTGADPDLLTRLRAVPAYAERLAALPVEGMRSDPAVMSRFLAGVGERYGSAADYLRSAGATVEELAALRHDLVELPG